MHFLSKEKILFIIISYFYIYFIFKFNFNEIINLDLNIGYLNIFLLLIFKGVSIFLIATRWFYVNKILKLNSNFFLNVKQIFYGQFFSIFIPSTIAIDYFKIEGLKNNNNKIDYKTSILVDSFDRVIGVLSFLFINSFFVSLFLLLNFYKKDLILVFILVPLLTIIFIFFIKILFDKSGKFHKLKKSKISLNKILNIFAFGVVAHLFNTFSFLIVVNLFFDLSIFKQLFLISASQYAQLIAFTPSAIGIAETSFEYIFNLFNTSNSTITGFSIPLIVRVFSYLFISFSTLLIAIMTARKVRTR